MHPWLVAICSELKGKEQSPAKEITTTVHLHVQGSSSGFGSKMGFFQPTKPAKRKQYMHTHAHTKTRQR